MKHISVFIFSVFISLQAWPQDVEKAFEYFNAGMYLEAAKEFEAALPIVRTQYNEYDTEYYAYYLTLTAISYNNAQQFTTAEKYYLQAIHIYEKVGEIADSFYGILLNNLALMYQDLGNYDKALPLLIDASENIEKSLGKQHSSYGTSLCNLARLYQHMGKFDKAQPLYQEALINIEKSLGKEHSQFGILLGNLALFYQAKGHYDKALPLFMEALENIEKSLGKEHLYYGITLSGLAGLYHEMGQYEQALPWYIEAFENIEKSVGKAHVQYSILLGNLAMLHQNIGQQDKAQLLFTEALSNLEKTIGKNHPEYTIILNNLACHYQEIGQYEKAQHLFLEALENIEISLGKEHPRYGTTLGSLASNYKVMKQYNKALSLYSEVLVNFEKTLGKDHSQYGSILGNMALLYNDMEQYDEALSLYNEALENKENTVGKGNSSYGLVLINLAWLYKDMEQYDEALPLFMEALENIEISLGKEHFYYGIALTGLAGLYIVMEKSNNAILLFQEAIVNQLIQIDRSFTFLSEKEKEKFLETIDHNFDVYKSFFLDFASKQPSAANDVLEIELTTKGMILNSGIQMRQTIARSRDSVAMAKFDEWLINRSILAIQYSLPIAERRNDLAEFEEKTNRLESELSRLSANFSQQVSVGQIRWKQVQEHLKEGECAIEFSSFNYHDGKRWTDSIYYCALVLTKDCEYPQMLFLFEENDLYEVLPDPTYSSHWDYNLAYQGARASGTAFFEHETYTGDRLYELIWQPIDSLLRDKGIETIYFAPSGLLHTVSFAAIPTTDGQLLMEKYNLVQLGSTRTVAMHQEPVNLKTAVVFGGIEYDMEGEELELIAQRFNENESFVFQYIPYRTNDKSYSGFTYLEGSLAEAKKVSTLLSKNISTTIITGRDAVEESFKALSGSHAPSVIHIATHGFYFPDTISDKRRDHMMFAAIGEERFRISDDPLMRSALVMAGASHAWQGKPLPPGVQDGILTARDVSAMNLANTELVVLSACQTGLGDIKGSEGVTGLQRAIKMAGVSYIIMSLWPVPDKETVEFMEAFYAHWLSGMEIRSAFNTTQKQMHECYPTEPFKWAAFVLME